jgi:error-prone DNA polymerase
MIPWGISSREEDQREQAVPESGPGGQAGPAQTYIPLHFRSYFSLLRGCLSPEEICRYARSQGYTAVGMADVNNVYGLVRFIRAAQEEGLKPVAGVVVMIGEQELFTAYVKNREGLGRINRLLTWLNAKTAPERNLAGAEPGPAAYRPEGKTKGLEEEFVQLLIDGGWEGLWLVSDNLSLLDALGRRSKDGLRVKLTYAKKSFGLLVQAARVRQLPLLALNTVLYFQDDAELYHLLRAIDRNEVVDDLPLHERIRPDERPIYRAATPTELAAFFSAVPEALANTAVLAGEARTGELLSREYVFPRFAGYGLPDQAPGREPAPNHQSEPGLNGAAAYRALKKLCRKGIAKRYGRLTKAIRERLRYELDIIQKKNFAGYFLVVHDIVCRCPRTCGRGSSASSIVSYLLEITHVDPLRHHLFFERFLNMGRNDPPDIDVDFPWDERDEVFRYVFKKYQGRAGLVANHVTLGPRAALRETAKALGARDEEIGRFIGFWRINRPDQIPPYIREMAERVRGFPQYLGVHCGGVVITPDAITNYTPLQLSVQGYPVIAWEKEATEEAGLVKIDLLGNRSLAVLRDTIGLVNTKLDQIDAPDCLPGDSLSLSGASPSRRFDWGGFNPLDDRGTRELIEAGRTLGLFYVESPATRQLLKKMREGDFERLVIASSIIRPAANRYAREFVERLHGKPYDILHPALAGTLKETYGIMVYQEDVSRVAIALAGFSAEEADKLRKIISKKDRERKLADFKERFFAGGKARGAGEKALQEAWNMILSFQGYSFCKAHSASYALVSYKLAYFKRYHPLEFMASVINNRGGFYSCQTYLNECQRLGITILGPDINRSDYLFTPVYLTPAQPALRIGFCQIRELHRDLVERILQERAANGLFKSFYDFLKRCTPGLPQLRLLIRAGLLDSLAEGYTRPQLFWLYFSITQYRNMGRYENQFDGLFIMPPVPRVIGDYSQEAKWRDEVRLLGVMYTRHPVIVCRERIRRLRAGLPLCPFIASRDIPRYIGRQVILAGLIVTGKEVLTRKNEQMLFLSFEDPYAIYETVLFPKVFRQYYPLLDTGKIFLLVGRVTDELGALSINLEHLVLVKAGESVNEGTRLADCGGSNECLDEAPDMEPAPVFA